MTGESRRQEDERESTESREGIERSGEWRGEYRKQR